MSAARLYRKGMVICKTKQNEQKCTGRREVFLDGVWPQAAACGRVTGVLLISAEAPLFVWVRHLQLCVTESLTLKQCGWVSHSLILGPLVLQIFGSFSG